MNRKTFIFMFFFLTLFTLQIKGQEGTKQLMPNSTDRLYLRVASNFASYNGNTGNSIGTNQRLYIYMNTGEKLHFGFKRRTNLTSPESASFRIKAPDGTIVYTETELPSSGAGYIANYTQASNGANGTIINGTTISGGYTPLTYTATQTGDYYIEFERWDDFAGRTINNAEVDLDYFDATVTDASNNVIINPGSPNTPAGRLWAFRWSMNTTSFTEYPVNTDFYVFTADEFVNKVRYEMKPFVFTLVANSYGSSTTGEDALKRQSIESQPTNIGEYKIFLNDPDQTAFPSTNLPSPVVKAWFEDVLIYDYDYDRTPQAAALTPGTVTVKKNGGTGCTDPSVATFKIESNVSGKATILLDLNGDGEFILGSEDKALYKDISVGANYLTWDLKNGNGDDVANGTFSASATFVARGPAHFPVGDVEGVNGVSASSIRPFNKLDPTIYWDDTQITDWGDDTGAGRMDATKKRQLLIGSTTPRIWTYDDTKDNNTSNYNGNRNTMNTWFNAIDLGIPSFNYQIITDNTACIDGSLPLIGDIAKEGEINNDINFTSDDFTSKFEDPSSASLTKIQVLSLPSDGILYLSSTPVTPNQEINLANLGNLKFTPNASWNGSTSFGWNGNNGTQYGTRVDGTVSITVNGAPTITGISLQSTCVGTATAAIPFTVGDDNTSVSALTLSASSSNLALVPASNVVFGGSGANRTITVTPAAGVSGTSTITVYVNDGTRSSSTSFTVSVGPSVNFTGNTSVCNGNSLNLIAEEVGADSYVWKNPSGATVSTSNSLNISNMDNTKTGTYTLEVTKGSCTGTRNIEVGIFPSVAYTGSPVVCGANLQLTATELAATSYTWRRGATTVGTGQVLNIPVVAGNYTLEVEKDGCTNTSGNIAVSIDPNGPNQNLTVTAASSTICSGSTATIYAENTETGVDYQLKDLANNNIGIVKAGTSGRLEFVTNNIITNTTFKITATKTSVGCTVDLTNQPAITVENAPDATLVVEGSGVCTGTDATVTIKSSQTGISYQAYLGATSIGASQNGTGADLVLNIPANNLSLGSNSISIQASINGCVVTLSNQAIVNMANPPSADRSIEATTCVESGSPAIITIQDSEVGVSYQLRNDADNANIGTTVTGTGGVITLSSEAVTSPITFNILGTGTAGCDATTEVGGTINVFVNTLAIDAKIIPDAETALDSITVLFGETVNIKATGNAANYTWTTRREDNQQQDPTTIISQSSIGDEISVTPQMDTWYVVTGQDTNGCTRSDSVLVRLRSEIYIPSLFSPNDDGNNDAFRIVARGVVELDLKVFDRAGNLLYETQNIEEATTTGWDGTHNGERQPISMYIWAIEGKFFNGAPVQYEGKNQGKINLVR